MRFRWSLGGSYALPAAVLAAAVAWAYVTQPGAVKWARRAAYAVWGVVR